MPRKLKLILLLPIAALMVLALVIYSPIRRIRIGQLPSARIGHFVTNVEAYICKAEAGLLARSPRIIDVFFFEDVICNLEIAEQWRRRMCVIPFAKLGYATARLLGLSGWLSGRHLVPKEDLSVLGLSTESAIHRHRGHLSVSRDLAREGDRLLSRVARGRPIVGIHVRDSAYLRHTQPGADYSYHDYRDWRIADLAPAVEELVERKFCVIRMGAMVEEELPFAGEGVFDYARSGLRSDRLDLYLGSRCAFWLGAASGLMDVPFAFRRPLVVVNHVCPLVPSEPRMTLYASSLWILKKYWSEAKGRPLSFREILESGAGGLSTSGQFKAAGIRFIDNTPEEIREAACEMMDRLDGSWVTTDEDREAQDRFWALWGEAGRTHAAGANVRIGARFLTRNAELLS